VGNNSVIVEPCTHSEAYVIDNATQHHHGDCTYCGAGSTTAEDHTFGTDGKCLCGLLSLSNSGDNAPVISANDSKTQPVVLTGRTLYKDGSWNTLCLPFELSNFTGTPLEGATVKTLTSASFSDDGTLTLNFSENSMTSIEAGKPYIVKWTKEAGYVDDDAHNIVNPMFNEVTISNTTADVTTDAVTFHGIFSPYTISGEDHSLLYLGAGNTLYWPNGAMTIGAFRAYFQLADGLTASPEPVRAFVLNFGDETDGIADAEANSSLFTLHSSLNQWYDLHGRRIPNSSTSFTSSKKGLYIYQGKKVVK
jgi:hypothetical protein